MVGMTGVFEGSFSASVRVDARNLALVAKWMQDNGQDINRSNILGQALKIVARGVMEQEPERQVDTLEQAYTMLFEMDLAPKSTRGLLNMAQALRTETMAQAGDMQGIVKQLRNISRGNGLAGDDAQMAVAQEMKNIATNRQVTTQAQSYGISDEDAENLKRAIAYWRQQGLGPEEIESKSHDLVKTYKKIDSGQQDEILVRQKSEMSKVNEQLKEQRIEKSQQLTEKQLFQNFTESTITTLENYWEHELQDVQMGANKQRYMSRWCPDATEEDYEEWLAPLLELARPKIESRAEDNRKHYEHQQQQKKAQREAKAAAELK